jgi:hypothetical protein
MIGLDYTGKKKNCSQNLLQLLMFVTTTGFDMTHKDEGNYFHVHVNMTYDTEASL